MVSVRAQFNWPAYPQSCIRVDGVTPSKQLERLPNPRAVNCSLFGPTNARLEAISMHVGEVLGPDEHSQCLMSGANSRPCVTFQAEPFHLVDPKAF
jgi:hypothetical protein